jgi:hypothetical protein
MNNKRKKSFIFLADGAKKIVQYKFGVIDVVFGSFSILTSPGVFLQCCKDAVQ